MKTKVILELGCNHNGDFNIAKELIDRASELGAWSVKLQKRDIEAIPDNVKEKIRDPVTSFGENYYEHRKALEFSFEQMKDLKNYIETKGMVFSCSAFDLNSYLFLQEIETKYIKLPSQLLTEKQFFTSKKERSHNVTVSTGMHDQEEILSSWWKKNADIVLHCISVYPCLTGETNMNTIGLLRHEWLCEVGYSSHDYHGFAAPYSVLLGAKYIERHFTLDKDMKGSDHSTVSSDPLEMKFIIDRIQEMETILGSGRELSSKEKAVRKIYRGF